MDWFVTKCPVDPEAKEWLETSFNWLIDEMSAETLLENEVVLPTEKYFPDHFSGKPGDICRLFERVCRFMDVDSTEIGLEFYSRALENQPRPPGRDAGHPPAAYQKRKGKLQLWLEITPNPQPHFLVATIAHELGHVILHGEKRLDPKRTDHESMTDLLTVFYGMGILTANSAVALANARNSQYEGGAVLRRGYMTEEMYGYALALFTYARGENKPKWMSYLGVNVRHYLKQGLKYLNKTGDTTVLRLK